MLLSLIIKVLQRKEIFSCARTKVNYGFRVKLFGSR